MDMHAMLGLGGFVAVCFIAASSGAVFRPGAWYEALNKPPWCPPNWLFPPAWSVLYVLMAVAGWMVWRAVGFSGGAVPLAIFVIQLVANAVWSAIFFGLRRPGLAFAEVILLWLSIAATIATFVAVDPLAGWLLLPYLAWVSFAAVLNLSIWQRNKASHGRFVNTA